MKHTSFTTNSGLVGEVRPCTPADAPLFATFAQRVGTETPFTRYSSMGHLPEESETREDWAKAARRTDRLHLGAFVSESDAVRMIGYLKFRQPYPDHSGFKHVADFGIMVLAEAWGTGLAKQLMDGMEEFARAQHILRIEARVRQGNDRGLRFFSMLGFRVEGTRQAAAKIGDVFVDEYYIGKILAAIPPLGGNDRI